ncbi:MAG: alkaline phosphatase family protein, partial [Gemmatimonadota bacterium]
RAGSSTTLDCDGGGAESWRAPSGVNVPSYISTFCGRFYMNVTPTYGTASTDPAWMYPLDGDRYAVGTSTDRKGGDIWTADAAIAVMENEPDWDGMLVSLPSIDKMAHMWGTDDTGPSGVGDDTFDFAHLPEVARIADEQVGRLIAALEDQEIREETLVVLTTDHAGQTADRFHGVNEPGRSNFNWYFGQDADEAYLDPAPDLAPLVPGNSNVDFTYQDGHIAVFLDDTSVPAMKQAATDVLELPDVIAAYYREGDRYLRHGPLGAMSGREFSWWRRHAQTLLDTMAADYGPDVVGLMRDDTSYGVMGDHGGHQRAIQEIPIVFNWPGLEAGARPGSRIRSVDITPTVLRLMGIEPDPTHPMDGTAVRLPLSG